MNETDWSDHEVEPAADVPPMVIDCHTHATGIDLVNFGRRRTPTSQSAIDLAYRCTTTGIDMAACYPIAVPFHHDLNQLPAGVSRGQGPETFPFELINKQHIFECAVNGAGRLLPFAAIDPTQSAAQQAASIEKLAGVIFGLKYHPTIAGASVAILRRTGFASLAADAGLPITVHSWYVPEWSLPEHVLELAYQYPSLRINIAHAAGLDLAVIRKIQELPNLYLDCAPWHLNLHDYRATHGARGDWPDDPRKALIMLYDTAPGSLLWGTDIPWTSRADRMTRLNFSHEDEVRLFLTLPGTVRRAIGHENPMRWLFGTPELQKANTQLDAKQARLMSSGGLV